MKLHHAAACRRRGKVEHNEALIASVDAEMSEEGVCEPKPLTRVIVP
jgi:hypothetical protein